MREECESSDEGVNVNAHTNENEAAIDYARSPKHNSDHTNLRLVIVVTTLFSIISIVNIF